MSLGIYDCPNCGRDCNPCYTKEDMRRKATIDKVCAQALSKELEKEKAQKDRMLKE